MKRNGLSQLVTQKIENTRWLWKKNWQILRGEANLNLKQNRIKATVESAAKEWVESDRSQSLLLAGEALKEAKELYISKGDLLSFEAHKLIIESIEARSQAAKLAKAKQNRQLIGTVTASVAIVALFALPQTSLDATMPELEFGATLTIFDRVER